MDIEKYFKRYGKIYGVSVGKQNAHSMVFTDLDTAIAWKDDRPIGYDIISRYLCTKKKTIGRIINN